jgi:hypothetical protein
MCECLKRDDGTWHVDECCAAIMDAYHSGHKVIGRWLTVSERMPEPGVPVLVYVQDESRPKWSRRLRASWSDGKSLEVSSEAVDEGVYDEENDCYWCPEGWYEENEYEETHWRVDHEVTHWMPLPDPPIATSPDALGLDSPKPAESSESESPRE